MVNPVGKDPGQKHFILSMAKSGLRIAGCVGVLLQVVPVSVFIGAFLVAEIIGIAEEL
jgi:hypothetical protein|tara:strand:+ start:9907 stop:10080 length:174 start_codon:yes stop_codon:yes gene_type:complete